MLTRHRLIWIFVGVAHLTLMAGLVVSDHWLTQLRQSASGNFVTVSLVNEENAPPELLETKSNSKFGGGSSSLTSVESKISLPIDLSSGPSVSQRSTIYNPPVFLVRENPIYPTQALNEGRQGKVVVKVFISPQGKVETAQILESSGSSILDKAAEVAACTSSFSPAERDHQPVSSEATATYRFELR